MEVLAILGGMILLLSGFRAVLNYVYAVRVNILVQQNLVVDLRAEIYDKLQRLSFRFFDANTTGSIITRVTGDVQSVRMFVDQVLIQSVIMVISLTVYAIYMASLSPGLTVACLATTPVLWTLSALFSRKIQPEYAENRSLVERMVQYLAESVQGIAVVKGFGREDENREKFEGLNRAVLTQQYNIFWWVSLFSPTAGFLTRINTTVLLAYGGWLVAQGRLPLGAGLVVFAGLLDQFAGQVNNVATIVNSVQQSLIGARRVFEILDAPIDVRTPPDAVRRPRFEGAVRFDGVSFEYGRLDPVLRDINLEVKPGECVAILGATGSGKSVLMSLIPRFYDAAHAARVVLHLVDQPLIRPADVSAVLRALGPNDLAIALHRGEAGHPIALVAGAARRVVAGRGASLRGGPRPRATEARRGRGLLARMCVRGQHQKWRVPGPLGKSALMGRGRVRTGFFLEPAPAARLILNVNRLEHRDPRSVEVLRSISGVVVLEAAAMSRHERPPRSRRTNAARCSAGRLASAVATASRSSVNPSPGVDR